MSTIQNHFDGQRGEARFVDFASRRGWFLYRGMGNTPYDFVADTPDGLLRVEVKWATYSKAPRRGWEAVQVSLRRQRGGFDFLFVATPHGDYWIPASACDLTAVSLTVPGRETRRSAPTKYDAFLIREAS